MEKWYGKQDYGRIEHYVREEASRFLKVFQYLSKYKSRLGITVKETPASRKAPRSTAPVAVPAPAISSPTAPTAIRERPAPKAAEAGKPLQRENRPAQSPPRAYEPRERPAQRAPEAGRVMHRDRPRHHPGKGLQ